MTKKEKMRFKYLLLDKEIVDLKEEEMNKYYELYNKYCEEYCSMKKYSYATTPDIQDRQYEKMIDNNKIQFDINKKNN